MTGAVKILLCLTLAAPVAAMAQIVMCTDERGKTYTADRMIPECQGRALRQYGKNANVVREIPAPLTAEERRQQQLEAEKKRELERARKEQQRQDQALLAAYRTEEDIVAAREHAAIPIYDMLKYEKVALSKAEERRNQARTSLARAQESNDPGAGEWQRRAEAAETSVKTSQSKLQGYEEELAKLRSDYEAKRKRFRELKGSPAALARQ